MPAVRRFAALTALWSGTQRNELRESVCNMYRWLAALVVANCHALRQAQRGLCMRVACD